MVFQSSYIKQDHAKLNNLSIVIFYIGERIRGAPIRSRLLSSGLVGLERHSTFVSTERTRSTAAFQ